MATSVKEDDVEDLNDDDIGMKMNKQVLFEDLGPLNVMAWIRQHKSRDQ
jgi:hypothetical protein